MKVLLIRFWPALVPVLLFVLWYMVTHKKRKTAEGEEQEVLAQKTAKLWIMSLVVSVVLALICIIVLAVSTQNNTDSVYVPARMQDGQLVPGQIVRDGE